MRRIALAFLAVVLLALIAFGGDINKGTTFQQSGTYNASDFNALVDDASINTTFFTDKTATTSPSASDVLLLYSVGSAAYRKVTLNNLVLANTALITGQTEDASPVVGDYLITYDASAGVFKKIHLGNFWGAASSNSIALLPTMGTVLQLGSLLAIQNTHTNASTTFSNFFYHGQALVNWTNITALTAPTNADSFLIHDASAGANRTITLASLITNSTSATSTSLGNFFWGFDTNRQGVEKFTFAQMRDAVTSAAPDIVFSAEMPSRFTTIEYALSAGAIANTNHGLAGVPQTVRCVLVCKTANVGYAVGDEVDVQSFYHTAGNSYFAFGANATNVYVTAFDGALDVETRDQDSGATSSITEGNWRVKLYCIYSP